MLHAGHGESLAIARWWLGGYCALTMNAMTIIEPHIHMYSRTTDDYQAMYGAGIRVCVEPSFWLGSNRRYAGTFFDYFQLILEFETVRARRFGLDHYAAVALNPKEAENAKLADEVIDGMGEYLEHPRCVALGEVGFNNITPNEERAFVRQLEIARGRQMPVIIHLPHVDFDARQPQVDVDLGDDAHRRDGEGDVRAVAGELTGLPEPPEPIRRRASRLRSGAARRNAAQARSGPRADERPARPRCRRRSTS